MQPSSNRRSCDSSVLVAVDVGNSRAKWGRFVRGSLVDTAALPLGDFAAYDAQVQAWGLDRPDPAQPPLSAGDAARASGASPVQWSLASVNPDGSQTLLEWIGRRGFASPLVLDDPAMLPLRVEVDQPRAVGIDRLLDAVAANERRPAGRPALIADCGSAITVDAVSSSGAFLGGAIAAGLGLSARGLHEFTYWLPLVATPTAPAALGKSTPEAMQSGLFWGTVGAVRELVRRIAASLGGSPVVYVTGGDGALLAPHLDLPTELVPDLTLRGIYLATEHVGRTA